MRTSEHFAGYELEELVAHGGMGAIYRARDPRLGRDVALRIVEPDVARDATNRARLNRELNTLASVDHPNVVPIYEASEHEGRLFIVSRWVDGVSVGQLVRDRGPLEPRRAVRIVNQVASALKAAHGLGIIHRSVKPASVLVTETDHVYLVDFGLARRSSDLTGLTVQQHLLESFDYLAPEYIEGVPVDARVDIYGLGCVLYETLTAEVPYPAATPAAKMYAHRSSDPPSVRARRPEAPEALDAVIGRAMAKDPAGRQQSAGEFAVEAAGAVGLSAPLWAAGSPASPARGGETPAGPVDSPVAADRDDADARSDEGGAAASSDDGGAAARSDDRGADARSDDGYYEPVYFLDRRPRVRRRLLRALGVLLFLAAPIALLLTLLTHGWS